MAKPFWIGFFMKGFSMNSFSQNLKPCPCCGEKAEYEAQQLEDRTWLMIDCTVCWLEISEYVYYNDPRRTIIDIKKKMFDMWNTRHQEERIGQ